ncbi:Lat1 dihydrolipoamide acetyltransferase component (E2) of pyruvate dehydrogenase complex [Candida orthopsilosis Co 90-125]|uniref:Acetyltransferase component of pyruvate dehydrogenase complex n=1 Tax=Candida orthopsilosis (strain 90-125) TaxID=1136231 RepID=H8XB29_CANO9|nr:Lat1 dihydrolipoamide acetyltransferase component (E2) of pyruvate dehydrogenase complex [Candida orthopsilosis Co 90-125]CCG25277.1 Lat1 dihydrolipoamide acetyltransferase component (E2) of pyruvate dehydrogenase complex [Candida orthopsilosis Co 90-125]
MSAALFAVSRSAMALRTAATVSAPVSIKTTSFLTLARLYSSGKFPPHTVIHMPALSPTMTSGGILEWSKKVGDELAPGEPIAEIETDKASMDFEFQEEGYLAKILKDAGSKDVPVGEPIAVYVEDASEVGAFDNFTAADAGETPKQPAPEKEEESSKPKEEESKEEPKKTESKSSSGSKSSTSSAKPSGRIFASPLAKTIALEKGISLKSVKGTGPHGRIVAKDLEGLEPAQAAAAPGAAATTTVAPSGATYEDIPLTNMRKTIATRLLQSTQQSPTYIIQSQISVSKLLKLRASLNASAEDRYKLSVNDLLIKAIAVASVRVPQVNAAWLGDQGIIRQYKNVDVSVAVATPTGLITPIIKDAHNKRLSAISNEVKDLGKRAKIGKLNPEEYQGGTICISNLGMNHAVTAFTSIINPPQSAIVAIGTTEKKAVPSDVNEQGFVFDDVLTITGTFDHRVVDGALGGEWIKELKRIVENPLEMLV